MITRDPQDVAAMLQRAIEELDSAKWRTELERGLLSPIRERRVFQTGNGDAEGDLWLFYMVPGRKIALAYSDEAYGLLGMCWGLVFVNSDDFGCSGGWYNSLRDLLADSGYFEGESG
jgi:hypothetical protein